MKSAFIFTATVLSSAFGVFGAPKPVSFAIDNSHHSSSTSNVTPHARDTFLDPVACIVSGTSAEAGILPQFFSNTGVTLDLALQEATGECQSPLNGGLDCSQNSCGQNACVAMASAFGLAGQRSQPFFGIVQIASNQDKGSARSEAIAKAVASCQASTTVDTSTCAQVSGSTVCSSD